MTHRGVGLMKFPLYFQIGKFKKAVGYKHILSEAEKWFYRGYLLHLHTDSIWVKCCMYPFAMNLLTSKVNIRDAGTIYYNEMVQIDSFYRYLLQGSKPESISIRLLRSIDKPAFWPDTLFFDGIDVVVKLLGETKDNYSEQLDISLISAKNVDRFLSKVMQLKVA